MPTWCLLRSTKQGCHLSGCFSALSFNTIEIFLALGTPATVNNILSAVVPQGTFPDSNHIGYPCRPFCLDICPGGLVFPFPATTPVHWHEAVQRNCYQPPA